MIWVVLVETYMSWVVIVDTYMSWVVIVDTYMSWVVLVDTYELGCLRYVRIYLPQPHTISAYIF